MKFNPHIWVGQMWAAHHCPLWSLCGRQLHCPPLTYLLTVCSPSRQAPSSLLEALEQHLASLEGKKVKDSTAASRYVNPLHHRFPYPGWFGVFSATLGELRTCFLTGRALCQMPCRRWPAQGCPSLKWMNGRSRQPWKRSRLASKRSRCSRISRSDQSCQG